MAPLSRTHRRIYFWGLVLLFVLLVPPLALYVSGYRLGDGGKLVKTGGIFIYAPEDGARIFINGAPVDTTGLIQRSTFVQDLAPGTYEILITKPGFWPWEKQVIVEEERVTEAIGFLTSVAPDGEPIFPERDKEIFTNPAIPTNPDYIQTLRFFTMPRATKSLGTTTAGRIEAVGRGGDMALVLATTSASVAWLGNIKDAPRVFCLTGTCTPAILVTEQKNPIRGAAFYPGRSDVLIIAMGFGIYAIDVDPRLPQNIQPIFKGRSPIFILRGDTLYVRDGNELYRINL